MSKPTVNLLSGDTLDLGVLFEGVESNYKHIETWATLSAARTTECIVLNEFKDETNTIHVTIEFILKPQES